jgi:DNA-directed RNA polymerase subunit RPC12/RpoP
MAGETLTDPARRKVQQVACASCTSKRFFLYIVEGEPEVTCTECGARLSAFTQDQP